jgi:hypothetical protein
MRKLIAACVLALVFASQAQAANYGDPRLDVIATAVAGHPVTVLCAQTATDWSKTEALALLTNDADGFTFIGRSNIIYLSPRVCDTLEMIENGLPPSQIGPVWLALAVKTILHESTHQLGVRDEHQADCQAIAIMPGWLPKLGVPATIKVASFVRIRKTKTYRRVVKTTSNPLYLSTLTYALWWHNAIAFEVGGAC